MVNHHSQWAIDITHINTMAPELKETDYIKAWALFAICATLGGFVAGAIFGGIVGGVLGAAGASIQTIEVASGAAGFVVGLPVSYLFFRVFVSRLIVRKLTTQTPAEGARHPA